MKTYKHTEALSNGTITLAIELDGTSAFVKASARRITGVEAHRFALDNDPHLIPGVRTESAEELAQVVAAFRKAASEWVQATDERPLEAEVVRLGFVRVGRGDYEPLEK